MNPKNFIYNSYEIRRNNQEKCLSVIIAASILHVIILRFQFKDKHLRSGKSMFVYVSSDGSIGRLRYPYR